LKKDEQRAVHMVNLILQCTAMPPDEVIEVILPDDLDEEDYVEDDEFLSDDGTPDLSKMLPNSDNNLIEHIYSRDATGRVVNVDARYSKQAGTWNGQVKPTEKAETNETQVMHMVPIMTMCH
jgi:hypothetical protein